MKSEMKPQMKGLLKILMSLKIAAARVRVLWNIAYIPASHRLQLVYKYALY